MDRDEDGLMSRLMAIVFAVIAASGCHRSQGSSASVSAPPDSRESLTGQQRVQQSKILTPPARAVWLNDLDELRKFITQYQAENGRYPTKLEELPDVARDLPRIAAAIRSGELVLAGGKGGVIAYQKEALDTVGKVITTSGVEDIPADRLRQMLGR
jgi:hypothetical protein